MYLCGLKNLLLRHSPGQKSKKLLMKNSKMTVCFRLLITRQNGLGPLTNTHSCSLGLEEVGKIWICPAGTNSEILHHNKIMTSQRNSLIISLTFNHSIAN